MAPDVSILTAVYRPEPEHIRAAWESVRGQEGVEWEWVVQVDGSDEELAAWLPADVVSDPRVHAAANGRRFEVAVTRNLGLVRCGAGFIQHLDQDDVLMPGALAAGLQALRADERLAFCFGEVSYLLPGGRIEPRPEYKRLAPGLLEAGEMTARWRAGEPYGFVTNSLMWRKQYLYAYGGWAALSIWADNGIIFPVADRHPVLAIEHETVLYRRHPGQTSRQPATAALVAAQRPFIPRRLDAMRRIMGEPVAGADEHAAPGSRPDISVLTALLRPTRDEVLRAWDALRAEDGPSWEWVVQADGTEEDLRAWLPEEIRADSRLRAAANGREFGAAITRNLALVRCGAELVRQLDQGDWLRPGSLTEGVDLLRSQDGLAFSFRATAPVSGPRRLADVTWRDEHLYAYGGWAALPGWEDLGIAMPVAHRHRCAFLGAEERREQPGGDPLEEALEQAPQPFIARRLAALDELLG